MQILTSPNAASFDGLTIEMLQGFVTLLELCQKQGLASVTVTSITANSYDNSKDRPWSQAISIRSMFVPDVLKLADQLRNKLDARFDVIHSGRCLILEYTPDC